MSLYATLFFRKKITRILTFTFIEIRILVYATFFHKCHASVYHKNSCKMCLVSKVTYFQSNTSSIVFKPESLDLDRKVRVALALIKIRKSEFD